jgi:hypothetical protein
VPIGACAEQKEEKMVSLKYRRNIIKLIVAGLLLLGLFLPSNIPSQLVHANPGDLFITVGGTGDCSQASPCNLATALITAIAGDTLYLSGGAYTGTGAAVVTITLDIILYGGWDGSTTVPVVRDPGTYTTILNGEGTRQVVSISGSSTATVDGFTITGGDNTPDGGGVYINGASPTIQNNIITDNNTIDSDTYYGGRGGGIFVGGTSTAVIDHNYILNNTSGYGAGIYTIGGSIITISTNEITGNIASHRAGGIMVENSPSVIQSNVISDNSTIDDGGGIMIWAAAPHVEGNHISGNIASSGGGISMGNKATPILLNNFLINNTKDGLMVGSSSPVIVNNTIAGNGLSGSGEGIHLYSGGSCTPPYCTTGSLINNIFTGYEIGIYGVGTTIATIIDYNDVWGNLSADLSLPVEVVIGTHNISLDPLFINPPSSDYHLQNGSPCINAGDPAGVPPAPPTDIDGDARPNTIRVDIGADEVQLNLSLKLFLPFVRRTTP